MQTRIFLNMVLIACSPKSLRGDDHDFYLGVPGYQQVEVRGRGEVALRNPLYNRKKQGRL
jgi:hypothetical protein